MTHPILNIADIELKPRPAAYAAPGDHFDAHLGEIGNRIGARKLGYNVTQIPPGKRAFPFHNHRVNEELFLVLEGDGEVRIGTQRHAIRAGDVIACPPGGPESAHQIINTSLADLKIFAVSTMIYPEICDYPDSSKFLVAEGQRKADGSVEGFRFIGRTSSAVDYWDGE